MTRSGFGLTYPSELAHQEVKLTIPVEGKFAICDLFDAAFRSEPLDAARRTPVSLVWILLVLLAELMTRIIEHPAPFHHLLTNQAADFGKVGVILGRSGGVYLAVALLWWR